MIKHRLFVCISAIFLIILGIAAWQKCINVESAALVVCSDTDGNGFREEYLLKKNQLEVREGSRSIWKTPEEWKVNQVKLADADNDGEKELLMVIWKKGSFGRSKPFWFEGSDDEYTCHLFVYRMVPGRIKAVWCSSALEHPILKFDVKDHDRDGINELMVTEGPGYGFAYPLRQYFSRQNTMWVWNGWGFERIDAANP